MNDPHETSLNELAQKAYLNAVNKGFHEEDRTRNLVDNYKGWVANLHGEASELWEAARKGNLLGLCDKATSEPLTCEEEELADIIIRALDTAAARNVNIGRAVRVKMLYNETRPHMHGKLA